MSHVQFSCRVLYCDLAIKQALLAAFISKNIPSNPFQILQLELWKVKQGRNEARIYEMQYKQSSGAIRPNYFALKHMNSVLTNWYMCYYQPSSNSREMHEGMSKSVRFFQSLLPSPTLPTKKYSNSSICFSHNKKHFLNGYFTLQCKTFLQDDAVLWCYKYAG